MQGRNDCYPKFQSSPDPTLEAGITSHLTPHQHHTNRHQQLDNLNTVDHRPLSTIDSGHTDRRAADADSTRRALASAENERRAIRAVEGGLGQQRAPSSIHYPVTECDYDWVTYRYRHCWNS
ncbi:hypothetical protein J6590_029106 [Homalodisca vitripennis]|nr:hypothetical protein J6590_029106 [Homalodisca vitripennis]